MANGIANQFVGLPIEDLIVAPLEGMAKGASKIKRCNLEIYQRSCIC